MPTPVEIQIESLSPDAVQAALTILRDLPLEQVNDILKRKRAAARAAAMEVAHVWRRDE